MTKWWKRSLALSLGLVAGGAGAAEPAPAVQLARPVIATAGPPAPAASLDRPVALSVAPAVLDPSLRPTAYSNASDGLPPPVIRAQAPDPGSPRPMPAGPTATTTGTVPATAAVWRRHPDTPLPAGAPPESAVAAGAATAAGATVIASAGMTSAPVPAPGPAPAITGAAWSLFHGGCGETCGDACPACPTCPADCGDGCSFGNRYYLTADYLLWWIKRSDTPPLVTRGSAGDPIPGALGLPGTSVLFGGSSVENNPFSGGRLTGGYWFGDGHLLGIELGGFFLGQQGENFSATSFGNPILTRPFINAATGTETTELVAGPGVLAGNVNVHTQSKLWGYEANLRSNLFCGQICGVDYFMDGILGFRALGLDESLSVNEQLGVLGGTSVGQQFAINDSFSVQNRFYGGQIGFLSEFRKGRWVLDMNTKVALGPTQEMVRINGSTAITPLGGATQNFAGGLLALPSNIGRFSRDEFTWVPEMGLSVGYQCTDHFRLYVGYNVLYWSSVVRPGNQIDRVVNTNLLPPAVGGGPARPGFAFNPSEFWAQGVTFGLEFKY
jgi:hypothetical protein